MAASIQNINTEEETKKTKTISPFKEFALFEKEIQDFANKFKTIVSNQAKRTSDYFEMSCFNYIVRFYELQGYKLKVKNLKDNKYRYKCSPAGIQSNFSHFEAQKKIGRKTLKFEIQHNLAIQSSHDSEVYTTPDISIIKLGKVKYTKSYYDTRTTFSYVDNINLISFCEVKQFNPFPELLFNFIGILNELKKEYMIDEGEQQESLHIAPSLMISGKPNKQTKRIKASLESRYCVNILFDLFYSATFTFSKSNIDVLRNAGKRPATNSA
ncbi:MAG: hypothetical protein KDE33_02765 [Bacteroidetes bacterium]|nr:hypothetical protein [Bacteroidota bacterium]